RSNRRRPRSSWRRAGCAPDRRGRARPDQARALDWPALAAVRAAPPSSAESRVEFLPEAAVPPRASAHAALRTAVVPHRRRAWPSQARFRSACTSLVARLRFSLIFVSAHDTAPPLPRSLADRVEDTDLAAVRGR